MLKTGQKVLVRDDVPFGTEVYIQEVNDNFYIPLEGNIFRGKIVTIAERRVWKTAPVTIYYYRIQEDGGMFGWLEDWFISPNLKDIYLIQLKDGRFIIIPRDNLGDAVFVSSFNTLADEVKSNCIVFEKKEKNEGEK